MFQSTASTRSRLITFTMSAALLLSTVLSSAQSTAASTPRAEGGTRLQQTGNYSLPIARANVPRSEYDDPHHTYPAIDIEVPTGTRVFAIKGGNANTFYQAEGCGYGVRINAADGAVYTYCHLSAFRIADGATVYAGNIIGLSGNTGTSSGPHLHVQIRSGGFLRCPQNLLLAIYDGTTIPAPSSLPTSGCTY